MSNLPWHPTKICEALKQLSEPTRSGNVFLKYAEITNDDGIYPLTYRRFRQILNKLEKSGFVTLEPIHKGRYGKSTLITLKDTTPNFLAIKPKNNDYKKRSLLTEREASYIAGLIDGEGHLSLSPRKQTTKSGLCFHAELHIQIAHEGIVNWLREKLGGYVCPVKKQKENYAQMFKYCLHANGLRWFLPQILSYSRMKKDQIEILLEALKITGVRKRHTQQIERLRTLYQKLHLLHNGHRKLKYG